MVAGNLIVNTTARTSLRCGKRLSQRHRELLVVREGATLEVQRLRFRQICATLEGVRARDEVSIGGQARGFACAGKKNISLREIFLKRLVKHQVFQLRFV